MDLAAQLTLAARRSIVVAIEAGNGPAPDFKELAMTAIATGFVSIIKNDDNIYTLANSKLGRRYIERALKHGMDSVDEAWEYAARMVARNISEHLEASPCLVPSNEAMEQAVQEACRELDVPFLVLNSYVGDERPGEDRVIASWWYAPALDVWCTLTF